jgi:hypothetical protein
MEEMERNLERYEKLLPLPKKYFDEIQDFLLAFILDSNKSIFQLVQLGEKVIHMYN